jgi:hypothetical protein
MTYFANLQTLGVQYTSAQTDVILVTASATQQIIVTDVTVTVDEAVTVTGVGFVIGFGTPSTPTSVGVLLRHSGLMPGSKANRSAGGGTLGTGDYNEDLRITSENPVGGALDVMVSYFIVEQT